MNRQGGFTLLELLVTVTVLAILLTVGVPSFTQFVQNSRVTARTNDIVTGLNVARSEAIKRGAPITVTVTGGGGFHNGWCVHTGAGCADAAAVLRENGPMPRVTVTPNAAVNAIVFDGRGARQAPAGALTLTIVPDDCPAGAAGRARLLDIANAGRINVERVACP